MPADVIDFFWERMRRQDPLASSPLAEMALDRCEEMMLRRDWAGFGYWLGVYRRERARILTH
jgi:hypothetical protein